MTVDNVHPDTMQALKRRPVLDVDVEQAERIRARCHRELTRRRWTSGTEGFEPLLMVAASGVFLSDVLLRAARLFGSG